MSICESEEEDEIKDYGPVYVGVPAKPAITTKAIWTANRQFLLAHREGNVSVRTHFLSCAPLVRSPRPPSPPTLNRAPPTLRRARHLLPSLRRTSPTSGSRR